MPHKGSPIFQEYIGIKTNPLQSAFLVVPYSQQTNVTGATIIWGDEIFDQNGDFANNVFTAPITGKYQLNVMVGLGNIDTAATYYRVQLKTSNRTFRLAHVDGAAIAGVAAEDYFAYDHTILANSSQFFQLGVTFSGNDTILVRASHADVVFIAWGSEIA